MNTIENYQKLMKCTKDYLYNVENNFKNFRDDSIIVNKIPPKNLLSKKRVKTKKKYIVNGKKLSPKIIRNIEIIKYLQQEFFDYNLVDNYIQNAKSEIENLIYNQNNNIDIFIKRVEKDCNSIKLRFDRIFSENELNHINKRHLYQSLFLIRAFLFDFISWFENSVKESSSPIKINKIKTNCNPSLFAWLFTELAKKGFIETPLRSGETNYTGLAKEIFNHFEINTTLENLIKEMNPNKNSLSDTKRAKFNIPEQSDLN